MANSLADIRYTLRMLRNNPGFALSVLLTLAIGIGANAAMFSIMDAVLLRPLPYPDPDRILVLQTESPRDGSRNQPVAYNDFDDWRRQSHSFEAMAAVRPMVMSMKAEKVPERVEVARVTTGFFSVLQIKAFIGRAFLADEDSSGHESVAVISHSLWQRSFASSAAALGRKLTLDGRSYEVVGVLPPDAVPAASTYPPYAAQVWLPLVPTPAEHIRGLLAMRVLARLKSGVTVASADAELSTINSRIEAAFPDSHTGWHVQISRLQEVVVSNSRSSVLLLLAAVGCVLLITCVNLANLLLARGVSRQGELSIRAALGADRGRIMRQLATESLFMALLGGLLGLLLAWLTLHAVRHSVQTLIPRAADAGIDLQVLMFTLSISTAAGVLFGVAPIAHASRVSLVASLRQRSHGSFSRLSALALRALVVAQTGLAVLLLVGAGLMIRSFVRLNNVPPGFSSKGVMASQVDLALSRYGTPVLQAQFYNSAVRKLREASGFEAAAAVSRAPMLGTNQSTSYQIDSHILPPADWPTADARLVTPGYFDTMKIPLLHGRDFNEQDREDTPLVMIVTREAALRLWPNQDAIGRRIQMYPEKTWRTVIGVVGDVKLQGLEIDTAPALYIPYRENPFPTAARTSYIVVRSAMDAKTVSANLRRELTSIDDDQAIAPVQAISEVVKRSLSLRRVTTALTAGFALMAFLLALVGVYGVMTFFVNVKRHDIGMRSALGAQRTDILWWILKQGMAVAGLGVVLGLLFTAFSARYLSHILFAVSATDGGTYLGVSVLLFCFATLACYLPARRATRIAPLVALREE